MGTKIKDAQLLESVTGAERIPVSDGSGNPKAVTTEALKNFVGAGSSGVGGSFMQEVTYAELKSLRNESKLVAGLKYRMTDYETTTSQEGTQSAGHPFDLILTALDEKTLDEKCSAIHSARDTEGYFASSNLSTWEIWYTLDNNDPRFGWGVYPGAIITVDMGDLGVVSGVLNGIFEYEGTTYARWDTNVMGMECYLLTPSENVTIGDVPIIYIVSQDMGMGAGPITSYKSSSEDGKGIVFRMIDESRNDLPYDFKNIMFTRKVKNGSLSDSGVDTFLYTFSFSGSDYDNTILNPLNCKENYMSGSQSLPNIVFLNKYKMECYSNTFGIGCYNNTFADGCYSNIFDSNCHDNTFGDNCQNNTFGNNCSSNTFGKNCRNNTFGNDCSSNTFGMNCYNNTFGNDCSNNTLMNSCTSNSFGNSCSSNSFGNSCSSNSFGFGFESNILGDNYLKNIFGAECKSNSFSYNCKFNTFGNDCSSNTFDSGCSNNTFGNNCSSNTFEMEASYNVIGDGFQDNISESGFRGNNFCSSCQSNTFGESFQYNKFRSGCYYNVFGRECSLITFGDSCSFNKFGEKDASFKCKNIELKSYVQYIHLVTTESATPTDIAQNYEIKYVKGTSSELLEINLTRNNEFTTYVSKSSDGSIIKYTDVDIYNAINK